MNQSASPSTREPQLFALEASRAFGEAVAHALGVALARHEERRFEDGEHKVRPLESVRERDVYVVHSLYADAAASGNDKLIRLLFFLGALRDAGAARVTAVLPYLAYMRKDAKTQPRDPVTTRYVAALFEAVHVDRVVALDVHNLAAFQNAFRIRTEHLEAAPLFARHFIAALPADAPLVVVSPDIGGMKRAERFRQLLGARLGRELGLAFMEKARAKGVMTGGRLAGEVGGAIALVIDDMISTGGTLAHAARVCRERGATAVYAIATHGLFTGAANETLAAPEIDRVVVTDSVPPFRVTGAALRGKLDVIPLAGYLAEAIARLHAGGSLVALATP
ncbi:ribose-phosphate pyrophosphokinase [Sulfurifustis variabilis]|uniref:ribose-phosphate diphosphokinase n=1 Tax=Sulfurifustis variabilis TaxID=1675686 RepID=A0A1B4V7L7_9GAMM|nr:ribose-phosphate pyrophosphokinase [Sulfurifustis variabilis]BAU49518.1 ribose-phosphate pyrophosphokinase [Sulfurifustis variabilis]